MTTRGWGGFLQKTACFLFYFLGRGEFQDECSYEATTDKSSEEVYNPLALKLIVRQARSNDTMICLVSFFIRSSI